MSTLLVEDNRLAGILRLLTAEELCLNASKYVNIPKLLSALEDPEISYDPATLFSVLLTDEPVSVKTTDKISLIKLEAKNKAENKNWSGMLDVMALATVVKYPVWLIYPNCNRNVRSLLSAVK